MTLGYSTQIWVPLFTFPTVQAPRYPHGYPPTVVFTFCLWFMGMFGIYFYRRKDRLQRERQASTESADILAASESGGEADEKAGSGATTPTLPATVADEGKDLAVVAR